MQLLDEDGNAYNTVGFPGVSLQTGQHIVINSSTKKIYFFDGAEYVDYSAKTDPSGDTFLFAERGINTISVNLDTVNQGTLVGSWRQYGL